MYPGWSTEKFLLWGYAPTVRNSYKTAESSSGIRKGWAIEDEGGNHLGRVCSC